MLTPLPLYRTAAYMPRPMNTYDTDVESFYPGKSGAQAIADVLFGKGESQAFREKSQLHFVFMDSCPMPRVIRPQCTSKALTDLLTSSKVNPMGKLDQTIYAKSFATEVRCWCWCWCWS